METLYAIGMMVGLMRGHADPPKAVPVEQHQLVQRQVAQHPVAAEKPQQQPAKKSEWPLSF
jgi:hypothetical protein